MTLHVCGSQQFPQLFVGDVYGISELIEKIGVEVDTILKVTGKAFDPSLNFFISIGELSQYLSKKSLEIREI